MKNQKGYTLVELLVTITVLGVILAFSLAIVNKVMVKNKDTEYKIYSDTLLQASKIYNDSYSEDTFANREYGCAKVDYSSLAKKDLISKINVKGVNCGYVLPEGDSSGVVIRKVKNKYYYEIFMFCKDSEEGNKASDHVMGGDGSNYFYELDETYCNTKASVDTSPPKVLYRNNNYRKGHFYNIDNLPQPQIKIIDAGVGLTNKEEINYKWHSKTAMELLSFTTQRGAGSTRWKDVPLSPKLRDSNINYTEHLKIKIRNVEDLAKNVHQLGGEIDGEQPSLRDSDLTNQTGTFYIDNTKPNVYATDRKPWRNTTFTITMNVEDKLSNNIRSGIRKVTYTLTNTYSNPGNAQTISINTEDHAPGNGLNGNNEYAKGGNLTSGSTRFKRSIPINKAGDYSLKIEVEDWSGNKVVKNYPHQYQYDPYPPTCGTASTSNSTPWTNRDREVTVGCGDQTNLSQCTQNRYSQTFGESNTGIITIKDNAGNSTNCTVVTKVDKTPPRCTNRGGSTAWGKSNITIYGDCTDNRSGCVKNTYSKTYTSNVNTTEAYGGTVYDNAGNSTTCPRNQHVHIDNTAPRCEIVYDSNANTPGAMIRYHVKCYDNYALSECDHWVSATIRWDLGDLQKASAPELGSYFPTNTRRHTIDKAGNKAYCYENIVASTCTKYERTETYYDSRFSGNCMGPYYYCPSGYPNVVSLYYTEDWHTNNCKTKWSYYCWGYKTYVQNEEKCGLHLE